MVRVLTRLLLAFVVLASALGTAAPAFQLDAARERWERLSPVEQARMRERFERLRSMSAPERASLEDRARYIAEAVRHVEERLSPEQRERLAKVEPGSRRALLRDLALLEGGDRAWRARGQMPAALRERFESVSPEQRARMLFEFERRMRERGREQVRDLLCKRFGLSHEEWERIDALPEAERMLEIAKLKRAARGPEGEHGERSGPSDEAIAARMKLLSAARPRPSDHLRYADRSTAERRELVAKIVRERVLTVLREQRQTSPAEIEALDAMSLDEFRRAIRDRLEMGREHHGPHGDGLRGDGSHGEGQRVDGAHGDGPHGDGPHKR